MPLDVISHGRRRQPSRLLAHRTQRLGSKLRLTFGLPPCRLVPAAPVLLIPLAVIGAALLLPVTYAWRSMDWWLAGHQCFFIRNNFCVLLLSITIENGGSNE